MSMIILEVSITVSFLYEHIYFQTKDIYIPSSFVPENQEKLYRNFVIFCIINTYGISASTCGLVFVLCCSLYETMGKLVNVYGKSLEELRQHMVYSVKTISDSIGIFKKLIFTIDEVDAAVNMNVLLLYGAVISGLFNTAVIMINDQEMFQSPFTSVGIVWMFFTAIGVLFVMACYGSYIVDSGEEVKKRMIDYSERLIRTAPGLSSVNMCVNFLFEITMKVNIKVTGGGMFTINCGLLLSITSLMVTYGVLILQLDR
ncbi:uncharacterized protein CEXT_545181 [Caerostris extrusa]|uniref:Gustatory receptor n=1 Tax=Caerostris extrusa TaxID=172846 RepID=A0AAV4M8Y0_CAEEX|nr:uncharacterized protein CEXT_545181 [Caerostris extrusa]